MLPHILHITLGFTLLHTIANAQNDRSYDTNDWVPIEPSSSKESSVNAADPPKRATGRVLNLDAPVQKFFPDEEYRYRKRRPVGPVHVKHNKERYNVHQAEAGYKFELPPILTPPHPPKAHKGPPQLQYFTNQEVKPSMYQQPPQLGQYSQQTSPNYKGQQLILPQIVPQQIYQQMVPQVQQTSVSQGHSVLIPQESISQVNSVPHTVGNPQAHLPNAPNTYGQYTFPNQGLIDQQNQQKIQNKVPKIPSRNHQVTIDNKENVQLVYVPLENLKNKQPITQDSQNIYKEVENPQNINQQNVNNHRLVDIENDFIQQALRAHKLQQQIEFGPPIVLERSTTTTTKPKPTNKRKPHQPPLAVYIEADKSNDIAHVIEALKEAKSITVQDTIYPGSPEVFIGPSSLNPTEGYIKFPLPYINGIDGKRVERKVEELPFFVAPLSYKEPPGYSKIPLPSPHVGSVVVSNRDDVRNKQIHENPQDGFNPKHVVTASPIKTEPYSSNIQQYGEQYISLSQPNLLKFNLNDNVQTLKVPAMNTDSQQQQNTAPLTGETYYTGTHIINPLRSSSIRTAHKNTQNDYLYNQQRSQPINYREQQILQLTTEQPPVTQNQNQFEQNHKTPQHPHQPLENKNPQENEYMSHQQQFTVSDAQLQYNVPSTNQNEPATRYSSPKPENLPYSKQTPQPIAIVRPTHSHVIDDIKPVEKGGETVVSIKPKKPATANDPEKIIDNFFSEKQKKKETIDINPLEFAINQFELQEINSQLQEKPRVKDQAYFVPSDENLPYVEAHLDFESNDRAQAVEPTTSDYYHFNPELHRFSSTPATILRDIDITTVPPTQKARRRGRPTRPTTAAPSAAQENYTVLEQFSASQRTTTEFPKMHAEGVTEADKEFRAIPTSTSYTNLEAEIENLFQPSKTVSNIQETTVVENVPANVYNLNNYNPSAFEREPAQHINSIYKEGSTRRPTQNYNRNQQEQVSRGQNLEVPNQFDENGFFQYNLQENKGIKFDTGTNYESQQYQDIQPLVQTRGQLQEESLSTNNYDSSNQGLSEYVNALQDQSVRSLLVPSLLVPTTLDRNKSLDKYDHSTEEVITYPPTIIVKTTTTTTTTVPPTESTTRLRTRGRTRGGSRFTENATTTRRSVPRRRQNTRTTTDRSRTTENVDLPRTSTKQRFRTRGRTTPSIVEKVPSTENEVNIGPTSEAAGQYPQHSENPHSYMQFENVIAVSPNIGPEQLEQDIQRIHVPQQSTGPNNLRPILQYENTATTAKPLVDIQINHPSTESVRRFTVNKPRDEVPHRIAPSGTGDSSHHSSTTKSPVRIRTRTRGNARTTSTTEASTRRTAENKRQPDVQDEEQEFYGFIRQPDFQSSTYYNQVASATQQPTNFYANSIKTVPQVSSEEAFYNNHAHIRFENTAPETTTVYFVGELRPKFRLNPTIETTTSAIESGTETSKPRVRQRTRIPNLRKSSAAVRSSNDDTNSRKNEQATRRSNVIRSRGRVHYKPPENAQQTRDEETDVEGGNYPVAYLLGKQSSTAKPSFQITIDPQEEDQAPFSSINRPRIVPRPEEWHEATSFTVDEEGNGNHLEQEYTPNYYVDENAHVTTPLSSNQQPIALSMQATTEEVTTQSSEESYNDNTKAIEDQFESVNIFKDVNERQNKKGRRRGVWKLVGHRPLDKFETAESQNYFSVVNSFDGIEKLNSNNFSKDQSKSSLTYDNYNNYNPMLEQNSDVFDYESHKLQSNDNENANIDKQYSNQAGNNEEEDKTEASYESDNVQTTILPQSDIHTKTLDTPKSNGFFDSIYEMFGLGKTNEQVSSSNEHKNLVAATEAIPTFPEEITEKTINMETSEVVEETTTVVEIDDIRKTETSVGLQNPIGPFEVEPWNMRAVRTSTSTEVSHETEICYKGRCIKSRDGKTNV